MVKISVLLSPRNLWAALQTIAADSLQTSAVGLETDASF